MREIKFRAWDKERKECQYFTLHQLIQGQASKIWTKLEHWTLFTGLKDKNDKEIYEGDIVKIIPYLLEIKFEKGVFIAFNKELNIKILASIIDGVVVGNIYENPELIRYKKYVLRRLKNARSN